MLFCRVLISYTHLWTTPRVPDRREREVDCHKRTEVLSSCDKPSQQGHKQLCHLPRAGVSSSIRDSQSLKDHFHDEKKTEGLNRDMWWLLNKNVFASIWYVFFIKMRQLYLVSSSSFLFYEKIQLKIWFPFTLLMNFHSPWKLSNRLHN